MIEISLHQPMTPSRLLRLVVDAVDVHLAIDKFGFYLDTFGQIGEADSDEMGQCFGCLATAAICHLHGMTYPELIATISPDQPRINCDDIPRPTQSIASHALLAEPNPFASRDWKCRFSAVAIVGIGN